MRIMQVEETSRILGQNTSLLHLTEDNFVSHGAPQASQERHARCFSPFFHVDHWCRHLEEFWSSAIHLCDIKYMVDPGWHTNLLWSDVGPNVLGLAQLHWIRPRRIARAPRRHGKISSMSPCRRRTVQPSRCAFVAPA